MEVANTVAYFETATIPALKSIIVQEFFPSPEAIFLVMCDPSMNEL